MSQLKSCLLATVVGLLLGSTAVCADPSTKASLDPRASVSRSQIATIARLPSATTETHVITFDEGRVNEYDTVSNQYADWGVQFLANAYSGNDSWNGAWADNTDMQVVAIGNGDTGGLGLPSLVSGNIMRSYHGWNEENGDPSFLLHFTTPISHISIDFAGVAAPDHTTLAAYDTQNNFLGYVAGDAAGQITLSFDSASPISYVAVTPGEFGDWVGVDNISFTAAAVPEPETSALMGMGLGAVALLRRRKQRG